MVIPPWPPDWPEIEQAAVKAIRGGQWGQYHAPITGQATAEIAKLVGQTHVRLCSSGSIAVEYALRAAGVGPGDEVILGAYDYPGNLRAVELVGARPVLVDSQGQAHLDPQLLDDAAGPDVKAVLVSHLFGVAASVRRIAQRCAESGWAMIEDACQVPGMKIGGRAAGSFGDFATLSFGGSKPLTCGGGGALIASSDRQAARFGPLLDRPSDALPLSPLQAAVLLPQLSRLDELNRRRCATVRYLQAEVLPQLTTWQWLSDPGEDVESAPYKVAWAARDVAQRQRIVAAAAERKLPIGEGFRSQAGCSPRRCRKPVPLTVAKRLGETLFVLDHAALLIEESSRQTLGECLVRMHDETASAC